MEDETRFLILQGCKLARDLESKLPTLANQPQISATETCKAIIGIFTSALEKLMRNMNCKESTAGYQSCFPRLLPDNNWGSGRQVGSDHQARAKLLLKAEMGGGSWDSEGRATFRGLGGGIQSMEVSSDLNRSASASQRSRRRRDGEKRVIRVAAPQMGNTDVPPDDGYTWRKYGQKAILGSIYPRGYYRCTHQKLYQCPAKKQVQRLDDDPCSFEVIYHHGHTCHMSSTAPLFPPPPPPQANVTPVDLHLCRFSGSSGTISVAVEGNSSGNLVSRYDKEAIEYPVADMATAMFNPGSSNTSTIDMIFHNSKEGK